MYSVYIVNKYSLKKKKLNSTGKTPSTLVPGSGPYTCYVYDMSWWHQEATLNGWPTPPGFVYIHAMMFPPWDHLRTHLSQICAVKDTGLYMGKTLGRVWGFLPYILPLGRTWEQGGLGFVAWGSLSPSICFWLVFSTTWLLYFLLPIFPALSFRGLRGSWLGCFQQLLCLYVREGWQLLYWIPGVKDPWETKDVPHVGVEPEREVGMESWIEFP